MVLVEEVVAVLEQQQPGEDNFAAVVLGMELAARVELEIRSRQHMRQGCNLVAEAVVAAVLVVHVPHHDQNLGYIAQRD